MTEEHQLPLDVEKVECAPLGREKVAVRVSGRWRGRRWAPDTRAFLVVEEDGRRHRFPAIAEPRRPRIGRAAAWDVSFALPSSLEAQIGEQLSLWFGNVEIPLPRVSYVSDLSPPVADDEAGHAIEEVGAQPSSAADYVAAAIGHDEVGVPFAGDRVEAASADEGVEAAFADEGVEEAPADYGVEAASADEGVEAASADYGVEAASADYGVEAASADEGVEAASADYGVEAASADDELAATVDQQRPSDNQVEVGEVHMAEVDDEGIDADAADTAQDDEFSSALRAELRERSAAEARLRAELAKTHAELDRRDAHQRELASVQGELSDEFGRLRELIERERSNREEVESRGVVLAGEVAELTDRLAELTDLPGQVAELTAARDRVAGEAAKLKAELDVTREAAAGDADVLRAELDRLGAELADARNEHDPAATELDQAQSLLAEARAATARLQDRVDRRENA